MLVKLNDWRGMPIEIGSIVVYPGRKGAHHWMVEAEVLEIMQEEKWSWSNPIGDLVWVLRVQPLRTGTMRTNMKPVKLTALERVTVVRGPLRRDKKNVSDEEVVQSLIGLADPF